MRTQRGFAVSGKTGKIVFFISNRTPTTVIYLVEVFLLIRYNRPFYRYGGHIELIRFKEYYRMPRGHEHISFVFLGAFRDIFSQSFLRIRL